MPASETSKSVVVGVATQDYHSSHASYTQSTAFYEQLLTEWAATPTVSFDEIDDEMDGDISPTAVPVRLGISTPVRAAGRLRSNNIVRLMKAAGFAVTTTSNSPVTGAYRHVLVPVATDALFPWSTFLVHMGGASILKRIIADTRLSGLTLSGEKNAVARFESNGIAGHEEVAVGTETTTADTSPVLRTVEGSFAIYNQTYSTKLTTALVGGTGTTAIVSSTAGFPASGSIRIAGEGANPTEVIAYSAIANATTFTITTPVSSHAIGAAVYNPAYTTTALNGALTASGASTTITVTSTTTFPSAGSIRIAAEGANTEETFAYTGKTATTFTGVTPTTSTSAHALGATVYIPSTFLIGSARNFSVVTANEFSSGDDNFVIGNHEFDWQTWLSMMVTGQVDTVFNKTTWESIFYGGASAAGSAYSFTAMTGNLDLTVKSATMVTGTTPYSMRIEIPHLTIMQPDDVRASGRSELRMVLPFRAYVASSLPLIRVTFVNGTTTYA